MAGGVDDVDAQIVPDQRGAFGQNGDAALAFEIVAVHGALGHLLIFAEGSALFQQHVHQGGFTVVDVGDDGDIPQIHDGAAFLGDNQALGRARSGERARWGALQYHADHRRGKRGGKKRDIVKPWNSTGA